MAGLISTGIWGFICSMLPTGERDEKGRPIMEEHFNTGFAGWGWKIWKTVAGFFRLEIDELVVRRTMTVFELLIQKIRAVKGAYAITQANGKIKTVELSTDGTAYLITLEESDMSFVEHDLIRCQEFMNTQKFYHVEIESITAGVIRIPTFEFDTSTANIPMSGDEIVQFGNSSHDQQYAGRHSAIYMHADESGQPAIDVMFDIYSKDWDGCVKTRVGGEIPGSNGSRGFYCENGMIKGVNNTGHPVYCIYPDGSAMFGDGSAQFNTDKSGYIAGGAIKWRWDDTKKKHVCTMGDVLLTWDNLSDEAKENLKGDKGDAGLDGNNGAEGVPGKPGADGKILYTWIRYADTSAGNGISNNPTGKLYIGFAYNKESVAESSIPSDYTWSLIKGSDGRNGTDGVPGAPGADGKTTYTWIAYSDSPDGSDMYQVPTDNTKYIGIAVNKDTITEGTNPIDYTWSLFKGRDGVNGKPGEDGRPGVDANLLPWIANWAGYATELGEEYIVTPKMFSGTMSADGKLTGIAQGKKCITIDGEERTGIFALVDDEIVFSVDSRTGDVKITGDVIAEAIKASGLNINDAFIVGKDGKISAKNCVFDGIYAEGFIASKFSTIYDKTADGLPSTMNYIVNKNESLDFTLPNADIYIGSILTVYINCNITGNNSARIGSPLGGGIVTYKGNPTLCMVRYAGSIVRLMAVCKDSSGDICWEIVNYTTKRFSLVLFGGLLTVLDRASTAIAADKTLDNGIELLSYWDSL